MKQQGIRIGCCLALVLLRSSAAFVVQPGRGAPVQLASLAAARSICTFDETDFASEWPYSAAELARLDNSNDAGFYDSPRFVTHIDDAAIACLKNYYETEIDVNADSVLDLCSSWISHLPTGNKYGRVAGVGMNEEELQANEQLTEFAVQDLNENPVLPYEDESFEVICLVVSVDYLTKPKEVFQEMHRVLRPGGKVLISFSNRCFPTKAVAVWLKEDDIGRLTIVANYFHHAAPWKSIEALDLKVRLETPERPSVQDLLSNPSSGFAWMSSASAVAQTNQGDPMFVVKAMK